MTTTTVPTLAQATAAVEKWVGYREGTNNDTTFGDRAGLPHQAWCMSFLTVVLRDAGVDVPLSGSTQNMQAWAQRAGRWSRTPRVGSIVIYALNGSHVANHCGFVIAVSGNTIATVEGNTSSGAAGSQSNGDCVARKTRSLGVSVLGFITLDYGAGIPTQAAAPVTSLPVLAAAPPAAAVKTVKVKKGQTLTSIALGAGVSVAAVLGINPSLAGNPDHVEVGQLVNVPATVAIPAPTSTPSPAASTLPATIRVTPTQTARPAPASVARVLSYRVTTWAAGSDVAAVQSRLLALRYTSLGKADGIYKKKTQTAVRNFQRNRGLTVDGVAGPATIRALGLTWTGKKH